MNEDLIVGMIIGAAVVGMIWSLNAICCACSKCPKNNDEDFVE